MMFFYYVSTCDHGKDRDTCGLCALERLIEQRNRELAEARKVEKPQEDVDYYKWIQES